MSTRSILINDELTTVPDDLAKAIGAVRADGKAKKKAMMEEEMMEEEDEDMEEYEDSADDEDLDEAIEAVLDENEELVEKNDSLEAENAVLKAIALQQSQHQDSEDEDEESEEDDDELVEDSADDEELDEDEIEEIVAENLEQIVKTDAMEEYVIARLDDILSAADEARPFLPSDFNIRDHADGYQIKTAALRNSLPHLDDADSGMIWDSADAIDAAFAILVKQGLRADSRYVPLADRVVSTRQDGDLAPMGKTQKRVRKPNYSI